MIDRLLLNNKNVIFIVILQDNSANINDNNCLLNFQVRSLLNVNLRDAIDVSLIPVIERSTVMCTLQTNHTTAKLEVVTNPIPIRQVSEST